MSKRPTLNFLDEKRVREIACEVGTPCYVYDETTLRRQAKLAKRFPHAFGLEVRFAIKACPNKNVLNLFCSEGLGMDASSVYEVRRALAANVDAKNILLTAQEKTAALGELLDRGVKFNATSLHQLDLLGRHFPGATLGLRINPGLGSGGNNRTNVGGPSSSFGIWKDYLSKAKEKISQYRLQVERIHTHIGSGSDPKVWQHVAGISLELLHHFESAKILNLGGGFKVARMPGEVSSDLQEIGKPVKQLFEEFYSKTGRKIKLEIEPGTFLVAQGGALITSIQDIADTGKEGYCFLKLDTGMTDVLRPSLYGAQHPLISVKRNAVASEEKNEIKTYLVVGHCCESGDILTPSPDDPEGLEPRKIAKAHIGDYLVVEGVGAYCSSMNAKHYNSFPESPEVLLQADGGFRVIRKRQPPADIWRNEI